MRSARLWWRRGASASVAWSVCCRQKIQTMRCVCLNAHNADSDVERCLVWWERWSVQDCLAGEGSVRASVVATWVCDRTSSRKVAMLREVLRHTRDYEKAMARARFWQGIQARNRHDLFASACARFRANLRRTLQDYQSACYTLPFSKRTC